MKTIRVYRGLYYPVMWELFNKPSNKDPVIKRLQDDSMESIHCRVLCFRGSPHFLFLGSPEDVWGCDYEIHPIGEQNMFVYSIHDFLAQPFLKLYIWSNIGQCVFFWNHHRKVMVNWWFWGPMVWIPGILLWKGILLRSTDSNPKPPIQTTNLPLIIAKVTYAYIARWWQLKHFLFLPLKLEFHDPMWRFAYFSDGWGKTTNQISCSEEDATWPTWSRRTRPFRLVASSAGCGGFGWKLIEQKEKHGKPWSWRRFQTNW